LCGGEAFTFAAKKSENIFKFSHFSENFQRKFFILEWRRAMPEALTRHGKIKGDLHIY
jgi:hypothetical protein